MKNTLSVLGCGNMCHSILQGIFNASVLNPLDVVIKNSTTESSRKMAALLKTKHAQTIDELVSSDYILLGIKPQMLSEITLKNCNDNVIISVLAGVKTKKIKNKFQTNLVVRAMPNMAAAVNNGLTGLLFSPFLSETQKKTVQTWFNASGETVILQNEIHMNRFTVLSGSLIGVLGYWEHNFKNFNTHNAQTVLKTILHEISCETIFTAEEGRKIINQTFVGYREMRNQTNISAQEMQAKVSSKKGVTEAMTNFLSTKNAQKIQQLFFENPLQHQQKMKTVLQHMFKVGETRAEALA